MPAKIEANSGIRYGYDSAESGWGANLSSDLNALGQRGVHPQIKDRNLTAPPGSPADGDRYIPAVTATGAWATHEDEIAVWDAQLTTAAWVFFAPKEGWTVWVDDEDVQLVFDGTGWRPAFEPSSSPASNAGTLALDLRNSHAFNVTLTESVTTLNPNNPPTSGTFGEFYLIVTQDGTGGWSITWPASVDWPGGTAPTMAANAVDLYHFLTVDGGTTWHGRQIVVDSK